MDKKGRERKDRVSCCNQVIRADEVYKFEHLMKTVAVNIINLQLF